MELKKSLLKTIALRSLKTLGLLGVQRVGGWDLFIQNLGPKGPGGQGTHEPGGMERRGASRTLNSNSITPHAISMLGEYANATTYTHAQLSVSLRDRFFWGPA